MAPGVEMVRVERAERAYDREKALGRDAASVFPSLARDGDGAADGDARNDDDDATRKKFVTESELERLRALGGSDGGDASGASDARNDDANAGKPLYQILAERREEKDREFQEQWASMKVGKNKPLDEEEVEFLDEIESERRAAETKRKREEDGELEAFKRAQRGDDQGGMTTTKGDGETATTSAPAAVVARKRPSAGVRAKPKTAIASETKETDDASEGLGGLLGDYGSDSDDDIADS